MQAQEKVRKPRNVLLSEKEVKNLYKSPELIEKTPRSFQCRLIFTFALINAMRPTELAMIPTDQIRHVEIDGTKAFLICGKIGDVDGTCKNSRGGVRATKDTPKQVPGFEMYNLGGLINIYSDIHKYLQVQSKLQLAAHQEKRFSYCY